jgi:dihydrofolate reductase
MSRILVSQFVSLDGVIEDPVGIEELGRGAWTGRASCGAEGARYKVDEMMDAAAILLGRRTYVDSRAGGDGVAILTYEPVRD